MAANRMTNAQIEAAAQRVAARESAHNIRATYEACLRMGPGGSEWSIYLRAMEIRGLR